MLQRLSRLHSGPTSLTIDEVRNVVTFLVVLGLFLTGLEGVLDSVDVAHDGGASGLHEEHHSHPDDPSSPDHPDSDGHSHYCHCGLHVPPLFASASVTVLSLQDVSPVTTSAFYAMALGPPPLPPPIV